MDKQEKSGVILTILIESLIYKAVSKEFFIGVQSKQIEESFEAKPQQEIQRETKLNLIENVFKGNDKKKKRRFHESSESFAKVEKVVPIFSADETLIRVVKVAEVRESKKYLECKFVVNRIKGEKCKMFNLSLQKLLKF